MEVKKRQNSQRLSSEQNHKSLISVSLLLNKFKIDQVYSIPFRTNLFNRIKEAQSSRFMVL